MCVYDITEAEVLEKDLVVYKLVCEDLKTKELSSLFSPEERIPQLRVKVLSYKLRYGELFNYKIGEEITSDFETTPGMYCFSSENFLIKNAEWHSTRISPTSKLKLLEVLIPKGSRVKMASSSLSKDNCFDVVLAERLVPIKVKEIPI